MIIVLIVRQYLSQMIENTIISIFLINIPIAHSYKLNNLLLQPNNIPIRTLIHLTHITQQIHQPQTTLHNKYTHILIIILLAVIKLINNTIGCIEYITEC